MSSGASSVLECKHLSRSFGPTLALSDVSLRLEAPATGLLGANGAGKSTLMRTMLGLLVPSSGSVSVLGMSLESASSRALVRSRVGYMPEHPCLPRNTSAQDLCVNVGRLRGLSRADARRRASEVLFNVGLEEERRRLIGTYSLGMYQRTKLAQALVHGPELVVLDEPTSGLDPSGRLEMLSIVRRISRELGVRVLISSHVLDDVESTCDEVVVLSAGQVVLHEEVSALMVSGPLLVRSTLLPESLLGLLGEAGVPARLEGDGVVLLEASPEALGMLQEVLVASGAGLVSLSSQGDALEQVVVSAMSAASGTGVSHPVPAGAVSSGGPRV